MAIVEHSRTDRFVIRYDDQIAPAQQIAQTLRQTIEGDFYSLRRYLPWDQGALPLPQSKLTQVIFIDASSKAALGLSDEAAKQIPGRGGGRNFPGPGGLKGGGVIWLNAFGATNLPLTPDFARFLFIAEMSEQLMGVYNWNASSSRGEALSRALAEQFQPDAGYAAESISTAPWVNEWLNSSPRFDYINGNPSATLANKLLGTDQDNLGFGCGILFINYLRYQREFPLEAICTAGGTTFADIYKNLTGRTDNPLTAMTALLDKHYGGINIKLLDNNPFPLLEQDARRVTLGFASAARDVPSHARVVHHVVHVSPFITCPAKDYRYHRVERAVTWTVTATAIGFARPQFTWRLNRQGLWSSKSSTDLAVTYDVPDPAHPRNPKSASGNARFEWSHEYVFSRGVLSDVLVVTNDSFDGVYHLDLSVEVTETVGHDPATVAQASLDFEAARIVYESRYYEDGKVCASQFESAIPKLQQAVDLVLHRPDPPHGRDLAEIILAVDAVRAELKRIGKSDAELSAHALEYAATRLGVEPQIVLGTEQTVK